MCMTQLVACLIEHRSMSVRISLQRIIFIYVLRKLVHYAFSVAICSYRVDDKKLKCRKEATLRAALFTNYTALQFCWAILCILLCRNVSVRLALFACLCHSGIVIQAWTHRRLLMFAASFKFSQNFTAFPDSDDATLWYVWCGVKIFAIFDN